MTNQISVISESVVGGFPSVELSVAVGSAVIALVALVVSVHQIKHQQKHDRLSVMPRLDFSYSSRKNVPWRVTISNCGFGTAEITKFVVIVDGIELNEPRTDELNAALEKIGLPFQSMFTYTVALPAHLRPDQEESLMEFTLEPGASVPPELGKRFCKVAW